MARKELNDQKSSYRSIFKATSLFGGVQAYQVIIQLIKSKFIAVLLGPSGFGVMGLFQSAIDLVKQITSLGISQSAVRDVSEANGSGDFFRISKTIAVVKKIVWGTGLLGLISVAVFSPILSKTSFGNYDYMISFIILSVSLLFDQLCAGQKVILQGMRRLRDLAQSSAIGVTVGLIVSVPLYYFFGEKGIVPSMVINAIASLIIAWCYANKVKIEQVKVSLIETLHEGKNMMEMGIAMSISGMLSMGVAFALRGFIRSNGGTEEVGLYQAGFVIINSYVGLVFNAISTDFYPRLAAVNKDNEKCRDIICKQGEIGVLLLAPLLTLCIVFMPIAIKILYSNTFLAANEFILWCCVGMMLRLASWVISFVFVAKSESKIFIINELSANVYCLALSIIGYNLWGLVGMGVALTVEYAIYLGQVYLIARARYQFNFTVSFVKPFAVQMVFVVTCLVVALLFDGWVKYVVGGCLFFASGIYTLIGLERRIQIRNAVIQRFRRSSE